MNLSNKFLNIIGSILMILVGFKILITQEISQGNGSMGGETVHLGSYSYIVGFLFLLLGAIAFLYSFRKL